jgi:hypothetical protein
MPKYIQPAASAMLVKTILLLCLVALPACDKVLNLKLTPVKTVTNADFEQARGLELPYKLYAPSSMVAWELTELTDMFFDRQHNIYVRDNIPLDKPVIDSGGARFKLSSDNWRYQFGFGNHLSSAESTFGVTPEGVVMHVEQFDQPPNDMWLEFPPNHQMRFMRIEFKLIALQPNLRGLVRISLHN